MEKTKVLLTGQQLAWMSDFAGTPDSDSPPDELESEYVLEVDNGMMFFYSYDYPEEGAVPLNDAAVKYQEDARSKLLRMGLTPAQQ